MSTSMISETDERILMAGQNLVSTMYQSEIFDLVLKHGKILITLFTNFIVLGGGVKKRGLTSIHFPTLSVILSVLYMALLFRTQRNIQIKNGDKIMDGFKDTEVKKLLSF